MTVEFSKTFNQNSIRKNKWPWNSKRLSIRIPVGKTNDSGILKDFRSEFQSEKPNWQQNFWKNYSVISFANRKSWYLSVRKNFNQLWRKKIISRTNLLSWRDPDYYHFRIKNLKYYYLKIPIYQILHIWVFTHFRLSEITFLRNFTFRPSKSNLLWDYLFWLKIFTDKNNGVFVFRKNFLTNEKKNGQNLW